MDLPENILDRRSAVGEVERILSHLYSELDTIDRAILALERLDCPSPTIPVRRRGRVTSANAVRVAVNPHYRRHRRCSLRQSRR
jgi:hypothetical protein